MNYYCRDAWWVGVNAPNDGSVPESERAGEDREPADGVVARLDEDDHDLLTYGEVAARLSEEIAAEARRLEEWEARVAAGEAVAEARDRCAERLRGLREAMDRNRRQPITDANFERFFGFSGRARRNT